MAFHWVICFAMGWICVFFQDHTSAQVWFAAATLVSAFGWRMK